MAHGIALGMAFAQAGLALLGAQERGSPPGGASASAKAAGPALTVAWCELYAAEAPPAYAYLANSLPLLLRDATLFADSRLLSAQEEAGIAGRSREGERDAAQKNLLDAIQKRDSLALQLRDPNRRRQELRLAQEGIDLARARYEALLDESGYLSAGAGGAEAPSTPAAAPDGELPAKELKASAEPRLALAPWKGAEGKSLAAAQSPRSPASDLAKLCEAEGIDYLFYGSIKGAGSFLNLELALYSAALNDTLWRGVEYVAPDALDGLAELFIRPAASALMGRDYARLFLETDPPNARIQTEGGAAIGQGQLFFAESLTRLSLSAPGYDTQLVPLYIETGRDLILKASLNKRQRAGFIIDSDEPGASVYLDGVYLGTVPLELEGFAETKVLRVSAQGKSELQLPLQGSPLSGILSLPPLAELGSGYKSRLDEAKDRFYGSLGWFVLSLPVSVLSFGSFRMYYDAGAAAAPIITDPAAIDSLNTRYIVSQSLFWASSAVSAGLAVNAVIKLIRYIRAAN
jgi:hypothetical protein